MPESTERMRDLPRFRAWLLSSYISPERIAFKRSNTGYRFINMYRWDINARLRRRNGGTSNSPSLCPNCEPGPCGLCGPVVLVPDVAPSETRGTGGKDLKRPPWFILILRRPHVLRPPDGVRNRRAGCVTCARPVLEEREPRGNVPGTVMLREPSSPMWYNVPSGPTSGKDDSRSHGRLVTAEVRGQSFNRYGATEFCSLQLGFSRSEPWYVSLSPVVV